MPTEAPKAITRAFEASNDFVNSLADAVILPKGWVKLFPLTLKLISLPETLLTILLISLAARSILRLAFVVSTVKSTFALIAIYPYS